MVFINKQPAPSNVNLCYLSGKCGGQSSWCKKYSFFPPPALPGSGI